MDAELKRRWVEALRSGEYKQGDGYLKYQEDETDTPKFCCLGVLANLVDPDAWAVGDGRTESYIISWGGEASDELPCRIDEEWLGLSGEVVQELASKNDAGERFSMLADFIEDNIAIDDKE